jgi:hypothetical protein
MSHNDGVTARQLRYNCTMQPKRTPQGAGRRRASLLALAVTPGVVLAAALLAGCGSGGPDEAFARYLARLSRTLAVAPAPIAATPVAALPERRELHLDLPPGNLDTLDFLALGGCAVQTTIGKRNSSLGRLARDSQRLLLDLEYLRLAPECIDYQRARGEQALADTLEQAWMMKRRQLPAAIFNATLGGGEYREFWKGPPYPAADYPANTSSAVIASMEAVNAGVRRWLAGDFRADNRQFEILLGEVATGDGGALWQALAGQDAALAAANRILAERMARGPLCAPPIRPAAADILPNVIRTFFIGDIQPRAAALNRRYHDLLPVIGELEQLLESALPPAYRDWQSRRNARLAEWAQAPRQHVKQLQAIQQPCGTGPDPRG